MTVSAEDQDFQTQMARVQALTRQLERTSDPAVQATVKELVQCMLEFNATAVNRMMEIVDKSGLRQFDCETLQVKLGIVCQTMYQARQGAVVRLRRRKIDGKPKVLRKRAG